MYVVSKDMQLPTQAIGSNAPTSQTAQTLNVLSNALSTATQLVIQKHNKETAIANKEILEQEFIKGKLDVPVGQLATDISVEGDDPVVKARLRGQQAAIANNTQEEYTNRINKLAMDVNMTPDKFRTEAQSIRNTLVQQSGMSEEFLASFQEYSNGLENLTYRKLVTQDYQVEVNREVAAAMATADRNITTLLNTVRSGSPSMTLERARETYTKQTDYLVQEGLISPEVQLKGLYELEANYAQEEAYFLTDTYSKTITESTNGTDLVSEYKKSLESINGLAKRWTDSGKYTPAQVDTMKARAKSRLDEAYRIRNSELSVSAQLQDKAIKRDSYINGLGTQYAEEVNRGRLVSNEAGTQAALLSALGDNANDFIGSFGSETQYKDYLNSSAAGRVIVDALTDNSTVMVNGKPMPKRTVVLNTLQMNKTLPKSAIKYINDAAHPTTTDATAEQGYQVWKMIKGNPALDTSTKFNSDTDTAFELIDHEMMMNPSQSFVEARTKVIAMLEMSTPEVVSSRKVLFNKGENLADLNDEYKDYMNYSVFGLTNWLDADEKAAFTYQQNQVRFNNMVEQEFIKHGSMDVAIRTTKHWFDKNVGHTEINGIDEAMYPPPEKLSMTDSKSNEEWQIQREYMETKFDIDGRLILVPMEDTLKTGKYRVMVRKEEDDTYTYELPPVGISQTYDFNVKPSMNDLIKLQQTTSSILGSRKAKEAAAQQKIDETVMKGFESGFVGDY